MAWFKPKDYIKDKPLEKKMNAEFRHVFQGEEGDRVLSAILTDLHYFGEAVNDEDRVLQNAAKRIIHRFGIYKDGNELKITKFYKGELIK